MSKKLFLLTSFVLVLALVSGAWAQDANRICWWSNAGPDSNLWSDANNWYTADWNDNDDTWIKTANSVPAADDLALIGVGADWFPYPNDLAALGPIGSCRLDSDAECYQLWIGADPNDPNQASHLEMTGGNLTIAVSADDWVGLGVGWIGTGSMTVQDGNVIVEPTGAEGGNLNIGGYGTGVGTFTMLGGTVTCYHLDCTDWPTSEGHFNLYGGTLYTTADVEWTTFWMGYYNESPNSTCDVRDGKAIAKSQNDEQAFWLNVWIDEGKLFPFGNDPNIRAELYVTYDAGAGETTLQAIATEPNQAWNPSPRPGRTIDYRPVLSWTAGDNASQHDVYFGTDKTAVENATTSSPEYKPPRLALGTTSYDPGLLELDTPYYWRIDEVNASGVPEWKGLVWDFKTANYLAVDDFESYTSNPDLYLVWDDYWTNDTGAEIFVETDANFVRGGSASMLYQYASAYKVGGTCYGSVADTDTTRLGISSNWTASGIKALVLYFSGDAANSATAGDQMWLQLEDTSSNAGTVLYDGDVGNLASSAWTEWNIDLADANFSGVSLANVDKIHIGFGGPSAGNCKAGGGTGILYFDDIRLYPSRCVPAFGPALDLTGDCLVGMDELEMVVNDWLLSGYDVNSTPPPTGPIARYTFDTEGGSGTAVYNTGSLGSGANGTMSTAPPPTAAVTFSSPGAAHPDACDYEPNYAALFKGGADGSIVINNDFNSIKTGGLTTNTMTLTCWVKRSGAQEWWTGLVYCTRDVSGDWELSVAHAGLSFGDAADWIGGDSTDHFAYHWDNDPNTGDEVGWMWRAPLPIVPDGQWTFGAVAVSRDAAKLYMYSGGNMYSATNYVYHVPTTFTDPFNLGRDARGAWGGARTLNGQLDDVRIYDYTLNDQEVLYVAAEDASTHVAVSSNVDFDSSDTIDFVDYGYIADQWLVEILWP